MESLYNRVRIITGAVLLLLAAQGLKAQPGGWYVNAAQFQFNMTITARIFIDGIPNDAPDNYLAAFVQGPIRGLAKPIPVNGQSLYFLTAYSNTFQGDSISFRVFLGADDKIYESTDTLVFRHHLTKGKISAPYPIHLTLSPRPLIYSIGAVDYAVNSCAEVLDVQASDNQDSEGNGLSYSIAGGADATKFSIDPQTGLLSWFNFSPLLAPPGDADGNNQYEVTVKVTDSNGLTDSQDVTVSVVANAQYPPLVCPDPVSVQTSDDNSGDCSSSSDQTQMYLLNPCVVTDIQYQLSGATTGSGMGQVPLSQQFMAGVSTVTYTNTLDNASTCSFTVTVTDDEPPGITCPANASVVTVLTDTCAAMVPNIDAVFSDNCSGAALGYTLSGATTGSGSGQLSGRIFPVGTTQVTYTVTDGAGLTASCTFSVLVEDEVPPSALCQHVTVQLDQNGLASVLAAAVDNGSSDACGIATRTVLPNMFTCANVGANTVTLTVTDTHGNSDTCNATVFVKGLSLGDLVYKDLNRNGVFDAGDAGINNVLCKLYADNGNGVLDAADGAAIKTFTTTTLNGQSGAYLFTELCPGNFIVEISAANFLPGGPLYDNTLLAPLVSSPFGGAHDPDNDLNNDDNGEAVAGFGVASSAITLTLNQEPDNDGDTDKNTNRSLDFGFKTPATVSIGDVTQTEGTGGTSTAFNFTVTRSDNLDAFSLTVNTGNGTAENSHDYTAINNGTLNFTAGGSLTASVTVLVNHDNTVEANETFTVTLSDPSGRIILTDAIGLGTINNDDNAVVTLSGSNTLPEGSAFTFSATLNNPVQGGFSVAYSTNNGSATLADADYSDNDGALSFAGTAGEIKTFTVNSTPDNKVELDETFTTALGAISSAPAGVSTAGSPQTGTISNDDAALVSILSNISQPESVSPQTFSISISNPVDAMVTVQYASSDGTATTLDNDYALIAGQNLSFAAGSTTPQSLNFSIPNDSKVESDEVYTLMLSSLTAGGRNVSIGTGTRTGTILNDDAAVVTLSGGTAKAEGNSGTVSYLFTATLNNAVQGGFTANYSTQDGTATLADNDYQDNDGTLSFAGTAGESKTFSVLVNGDVNIEADESFQTSLNSLTGIPSPPAVTIAASPQTATISNDEQDWGDAPDSYATLLASNGARHGAALGGLRLGASIDGDPDGQPNAAATGDGADEDGVQLPSALVLNTTAAITVNASAAGKLNAWVDYNRDGDWADIGEQVLTNQNVVAGNNSLSFAVPGNATLGASYARFRLASASGASFNGPAADGEVEDYAINIVNTQFTINDPVVVEGNSGTSNLGFVISRTVNANACSVDYAITGGSATTADGDYQVLAAGTVQFTAGGAFSQTINVLVNGDLKVELNETVDMSLSNPVDGSILDGAGTGTINNDDNATISVNNPSLSEGDNGSVNASFIISMSNPSDAEVTFSFSTLDGIATLANNDYTAVSGSHTFSPGEVNKQVNVPIIGDCSIEANETFLLRLNNLLNNGRSVIFSGGSNSLDGTGAINNDDALPVITCPANLTVNVDPGVCTTSVTIPLPTTSSLCGSSVLEFRFRSVDAANVPTGAYNTYAPSGSNTLVFGRGRYEVEWRITDGSGVSVCSFFLQVNDNQPPSILCPANQTLQADAACSALLGAWNAVSVSDNCTASGAITVTQSPAAATLLNGHNDLETVTLTANDGNGNTQNCTFTVTLKDVTAPVIVCKQFVVNLNTAGLASVAPADVYQSGSDNCGTVNLQSVVPNSFGCNNIGANTVTLTANDGNGNTSTCTTIVKVQDPVFPTVLCKNATLNLNAAGQATLTVAQINNGSFDNCSLASLTLSQTLFTCANIGNNTVILTGKDPSNNTAQCTATVTIVDPILPVAKCKNATVSIGANGSVTVPGSTIDNGSTDNCALTLTLTPNTFTCANIGLKTVTLKATDAGGNMSTCTAKLTVKDMNGPTALCKNATIFLNNVGQATLTVAQVNNGSSDNCGISTMSLNRTAFNCADINAAQPVTLSLTDVNGNSSSCTASVTVKDAIAPSAVCENVSVKLSASGYAVVYGADLASESTDNCAVWSYSPTAKTYTAANLGNNNLTITVKDWSGNSATCVSVVNVSPFNNIQNKPGSAGLPGWDEAEKGVFKLYPNPSFGDFAVAFDLPSEQNIRIQLFDLQGRMVYEQESPAQAGENTLHLRADGLAPGLYLLDFQSVEMKVRRVLMLRE